MYYHFKVHKEGNGYWAECCELSHCQTETDGPGSREDLRKNCREVLNLYLDEPPASQKIMPMPDPALDSNHKLMRIEAEPQIAFSQMLRTSRLKAQLTQQQAAQLLNMKIVYSYQRLEKRSNPTLALMTKVKNVFPDIQLQELFQ
jgi:predicted RNase H-like HicB family nuclease/DNA-binding XRE family transcriptional regulator